MSTCARAVKDATFLPLLSETCSVLQSEQVITTMNFFPRCDFLRVIVATTLFGRLVDVENVDLLLDEFTHVRPRGIYHCSCLLFGDNEGTPSIAMALNHSNNLRATTCSVNNVIFRS